MLQNCANPIFLTYFCQFCKKEKSIDGSTIKSPKRGDIAVPLFSGQNCALHLKKYFKKYIFTNSAKNINKLASN